MGLQFSRERVVEWEPFFTILHRYMYYFQRRFTQYVVLGQFIEKQATKTCFSDIGFSRPITSDISLVSRSKLNETETPSNNISIDW